MATPPVPTTTVTFNLPEDLDSAIRARAARLLVSKSALIRMALADFVAQKSPGPSRAPAKSTD